MRYPPRAPVCCGLFDLYQVVGTRCADRHHGLWHVGWSISITVCTHFSVDLKLFSLWMCTVNVFFISFIYSCFTHCAYLIRLRIWYAYICFHFPLNIVWYFLSSIFYLNNETAAVMSIWMFLIALSVLLIYNFLRVELFKYSHKWDVFTFKSTLCIFNFY